MRAHDQLALLMAARGASAEEMQSELLQLDQSLASLAFGGVGLMITVGYARWRASRALAFRQLSDALA